MNGIIIIDKPSGWTSHDVIAKLRGVLKEKRIGHGGTLDPMATGVLPVFVGRATRAVEYCESAEKEYVAGLRLGVVTDTQDTTGTILSEHEVCVTDEEFRAVVSRFVGAQEQLPPMYSAVKIGGTKLYELARRGIEAERKPRPITIKSIEILGRTANDYLLRIVCSKGTYVRTLCHDIGAALGCGGTMSSLRRTRAGIFSLSDAVTLSEVEATAAAGGASALLKPVDALFLDSSAVVIDAEQKLKCLNGNAFTFDAPDGVYRVYDGAGSFLMLGRAEDGILHTVKSFFNV